jgi:hypothetical protein
MRRLALLALLALGAFVVIRRRRAADDAADVWFDDGSIVSLPRSSPAGGRLAELADDVLSAAR